MRLPDTECALRPPISARLWDSCPTRDLANRFPTPFQEGFATDLHQVFDRKPALDNDPFAHCARGTKFADDFDGYKLVSGFPLVEETSIGCPARKCGSARRVLIAPWPCVLLDVAMPNLNGFEAAKLSRGICRGADRFRHGDFIFSMALVSVTDNASVAFRREKAITFHRL